MSEKEKRKVTRRKFLGDSSKNALAGTAAVFLGLGFAKPAAARPVQPAFCLKCMGGCSGTCSSGCEGSCYTLCWGTCSHVCDISGKSLSADQSTRCGTPVLQQEISKRNAVA
jgi:anaerobic selenocysteine-containing dehydrogenase